MRLTILRTVWFVVGIGFAATTASAAARQAEWKRVDDAIAHQLPKTALAEIEPILRAALAERAYPEAVKATVRKISLETHVAGGNQAAAIAHLQSALDAAPTAMRPVLETILAEWYWRYFQENRWKILQRTQLAGNSGPELETWDLRRILAEIDARFSAALAHDTELKSIPIGHYDELLPPASAPDDYRPTLYDFIAHEALKFYQAGEQVGAAAEAVFDVDAEGPVFGDARAFLDWKIDSASTSPQARALRVYQTLLRFHERDADRSAFFDLDFERIEFGRNIAQGENRDLRYKTALEHFIAVTAKHPISSRARAALAQQWLSEEEYQKARDAAMRGRDAFPGTAGAIDCINIIRNIEAPSVALATENVWSAPWPKIDVTYRNIKKLHFRAYTEDFAKYVEEEEFLSREAQEGLVQNQERKPALDWDVTLPATSEYKERTESVGVPTLLKPGFYLIVASADASFASNDNYLALVPVWVSNLALVTRIDYSRGTAGGWVVRADTGEPVAGARVRTWSNQRRGKLVEQDALTTDADGRFELSSSNGSLVFLAEHAGQSVASNFPNYFFNSHDAPHTEEQTVFFTDRALYRPGLSIDYKGICISADRAAGKYNVRPHHEITVVFKGANGQEIARAVHRTNDYGSFSGVFTAPRDSLLGRMTLEAVGELGAASFSVEEYKRPKFQVELEGPAQAPRLAERVVVAGRATAYSGASLGGATVKWRVTRGVQLPPWCWWWSPPPTKAIAHGSLTAESDGTFRIAFPAEPDRSVPAKDEPVFTFTVHTDVTDSSGETRSADRYILVGYTSLRASVLPEPWQTSTRPVVLNVGTTALEGEPQAASGIVTVYRLTEPASVVRPALSGLRSYGRNLGMASEIDPSNPDGWEIGNAVAREPFSTNESGSARVEVKLEPGLYRAVLESKDRFGEAVTARAMLTVLDPSAPKLTLKLPNVFKAERWSLEPGETFEGIWGTGYPSGRAYIEVECAGKTLASYWTDPQRTQVRIQEPVTEAMRGGFTVRATFVRENRIYTNDYVVDVPWTNRKLTVKWESFRSKLLPGAKETWSAVITGPDSKRAAAEMVATLYDASLDQFAPHAWLQGFDVFRREYSSRKTQFNNVATAFDPVASWDGPKLQEIDWKYRAFPADISLASDDETVVLSPFLIESRTDRGYRASQTLAGTRIDSDKHRAPIAADRIEATPPALADFGGVALSATPAPDLNAVAARQQLAETAFFFPHLIAGGDGIVKMEFTMPEALTRWKFMGFAHDTQLRSGFLSDSVVTSKDLMVEPNPPRFVREGDVVEFTVKVSNLSAAPMHGAVRLTFADAATLESKDASLANRAPEQPFDLGPKASRTFSWRIAIPDEAPFLTYKAVAASGTWSDGEEGYLPVLSRHVLVAESLPLPIRGPATKTFELKKLLASGGSPSLRNEALTVQMVSQPAWYAVLALPYLMEFPYECSEQVFNRVYANALAHEITNSDPKIQRVFEQWKTASTLQSPLEKNPELKAVALEETPWVREARSESEARHRIGLLFDGNRTQDEIARALKKLADQQLPDGRWPWFPGGPASDYISLYIVAGFGRLQHLGVAVDAKPALSAIAAVDQAMREAYQRIRKSTTGSTYVPTDLDALYLYGRSFFLAERPIAGEDREAVNFFLAQARRYWTQVGARQSQAQLALALQRFGDADTAQAIVRSLKERSVIDAEMGMSWRDAENGWWWYQAPIETQAMMIEALAEIAHDADAVEACQVWLLKQKQTQHWPTTKATADAVYAILLGGRNLLGSDGRVEVTLGSETLRPEKVEAGTGFYEQRFVRGEIKPTMGRITVNKTDDGVSWGSVHWQYLEDIAQVTPHTGTPLQLKKTLFVRETTAKGLVLQPIVRPLAVGDEVIVRLELRIDRDLEFVHLKDARASGTEPVHVLSGYRYQDGLGYYESTRDTATHFFFDRLPRGVYVFEYPLRVQLRGRYQCGLAEIECMYAPEFNSHSESVELKVE